MPTGYTQKLLDGSISTLPDFAESCISAFGAGSHMRDDKYGAPFKKRTVPSFYVKSLADVEYEIEQFNKLTNAEVLNERLVLLNENLKYNKDKIVENNKNFKILNSLINELIDWIPPTDDYVSFKTFMLDQLQSTLEADCDNEYNESSIKNITKELSENPVVEDVKLAKLKRLEDDLAYSKNNLSQQKELVKKSNIWVDTLLNSI